jgi:hypothetical protein
MDIRRRGRCRHPGDLAAGLVIEFEFVQTQNGCICAGTVCNADAYCT